MLLMCASFDLKVTLRPNCVKADKSLSKLLLYMSIVTQYWDIVYVNDKSAQFGSTIALFTL